MSMRNWIEENKWFGAVLVLVALAAAGASVYWNFVRQPPPAGNAIVSHYFYDLGRNELIVLPATTPWPTVLPSGAEAVRARVFACGSCDKAEDRFIGYLERMPDDTLALVRELQEKEQRKTLDEKESRRLKVLLSEAAPLIRGPEGGPWIPFESDEARDIINAYTNKCPPDKRPPRMCLPK